MPLFFFHLRTTQGLQADVVGTPFPDLDAAYLDVCRAIPAMVEGLLHDGHDPLRCGFEIADEGGKLLMDVPFTERLTKGEASHPVATAHAPAVPPTLDELAAVSASIIAKSQETRRSIRRTREEVAQLARTKAERGVLGFVRLLQGVDSTDAVDDGHAAAKSPALESALHPGSGVPR